MSLRGVYDPDNIFAKIVRGEAPCAKVYEDEKVIGFLDVFPQSRGHTLVISKQSRARNLLEVEPADLQALMVGVQKCARAVERALGPDGLIITQFNGSAAAQTVFHLHFHIIPRWNDVTLAGHGQAGMADPAQLKVLADSIAAHVG